jgi:sugar/nucleoside kinase (ribokinase family)
MKAVALGAHILDVLVRPVTEIPEGQGGTLVEEIRLSPAGAAGGVAVTLGKLGAEVHSAGAVGKDRLGDVLVAELERFGVDCTHLVRREGVQTSSTVLPIRPNGERPALHVIGANGSYGVDDVPWDTIERADFLHLGGPEFIGPEAATEILRFCREHDTRTSMDILADGWPELLDMIAPALEHLDYLLPNDDQAMKLTGTDDVVEAARALLERGVGLVAVTCGADGSVVVDGGEPVRVPAFEVEVVDTTGCGDAYSAGFLRGLSLGREPADAAVLGSACASLVAQGLGTDAGDFDTDAVVARAAS